MKNLNVEVKMYGVNGSEANFFVPLKINTGNNGNYCFNLPAQTGKYTVKVYDGGKEIFSRNLQIEIHGLPAVVLPESTFQQFCEICFSLREKRAKLLGFIIGSEGRAKTKFSTLTERTDYIKDI